MYFGIIDPALALWLVLAIGGGWWCKEILERFGDDLAIARSSPDTTRRAVIVFFWILTLPVILLTTWAAWCVVARIVGGVMSLIHP